MRKFAALLAFLVIVTACSRGINSSPNLPPQNAATAVPEFTPSPVQTFSPNGMPHYRFVPLPPYFQPFELNDNGIIVGLYRLNPTFESPTDKAAVYESGQLRLLGTLPGDTDSIAFGINNKNQAVGWSGNVSSEEAVLYSDGHVYDLHETGYARAINNEGLIAGITFRFVDHASQLRVVLFDAGTCTPILYPFGDLLYSSVAGINDAGQYVGTYYDPQMQLDQAYVAIGTAIHPLGIAGYASDIDNHGDIVGGAATEAGRAVPFIRNGATGLITVPILPGFSYGDALAINDADQVIGNSYSSAGDRAAFLYQSGKIASFEQMTDKPGLYPIDINNRGEIAVLDEDTSLGGMPQAGILEPIR